MIKRSFLWKTAAIATATRSSASSGAFVSSRAVVAAYGFNQCTKPRRFHSTTATNKNKNNNPYRQPGTTSLFESMRTGYYRKTNSDEITIEKLLEKATSVLQTIPSDTLESMKDDPQSLYFDSSYESGLNQQRRGFSNWILPGVIMVGQYPGRVPETNTPTEEEVSKHISKVLYHNHNANANRVCFISLQSELPPQDDHDSWIAKHQGEIYLADAASRKEWPNPFSHYASTVTKVLENENTQPQQPPTVKYIHHPIKDLSVPSNSKNLKLLLWKILDFLDHGDDETKDNNTTTSSLVYIHCWGGRGRAGLTASCLLTLLEFAQAQRLKSDLVFGNAQSILEIVQKGYSSRLGHENMSPALSRSPQTDSQRAFVKAFYEEVRSEAFASDSK